MERPMSIAVMDENTPTAHDEEHHVNRIERPMSVMVVDEDMPPVHHDAHRDIKEDAPVPRKDAGAATPMADHSMRLPYFDESCPHVRDQIIRMNGGRFNVDHYLRVLRVKAELDESIAMALTVAGQQRIVARAARHFTLVG